GLFHAFLDDTKVRLIGVEAGGTGLDPGRHAARFAGGGLGVLQGTRTFLLQDTDGNILPTHSVSAGLDYARSEERRVGKGGRSDRDWSSDVCSSDLGCSTPSWMTRRSG